MLIRPLGRENLKEQLELSVIKEFIKFKENQSHTPLPTLAKWGNNCRGELDFSPTAVARRTSRPINRGRDGVSNQFPSSLLLINSDGFAKANDDDDCTVYILWAGS